MVAAGAEAAKFGFESFAFRVSAAGDDDARALIGEGDGGGATDAGQGPVIKTTDVFMGDSSCFGLLDTQGMAGETGELIRRHRFLRNLASVAG